MTSQVVLEFNEPIIGSGRVIQLGAIAPLTMGSAWTLPGIRPQDVFWQEGGATLVVREPLAMTQLQTQGCRQAKIDPLTANVSAESLQFQYFVPDATIALTIVKRPPRIRLATGTTVYIDGTNISGTMIAQFSSLQGQQFELEGLIAQRWIVDAVETEPAQVLDDWTVSGRDASHQTLRLHFNRAIDERHPASVRIYAHRRMPALEAAMGVAELRFAEFQDPVETRHLISLEAAPAYQLELAGDAEVVRLEWQQLAETELALFDENASGLLFVDDAATAGMTVSLKAEDPRYSAEIEVGAVVHPDSLTEHYRIACKPASSQVSRLLVQLSQARAEPLQWTMTGEGRESLSARRQSEIDAQSANLDGGETWEIMLRRPRTVPFEIQATRSRAMDNQQHISLPSLPEAASQTGTLTVGSVSGIAITIDDRNLKSIPSEPVLPQRYTTTRAMYRYEPSQNARVLISQAPPGDRQPAAWAWSSDLVSRQHVRGASYDAVYRLENTGRPQFTCRLPEHAVLQQVSIDSTEVAVTAKSSSDGTFVVPLPDGGRFPTVRISYAVPGESLGIVRSLRAAVPELDIPVLEQTWTAWLPPGFAAAGSDSGTLDSRRDSSWSRRLLGPLRRSRSAAPLLALDNPWRALGQKDERLGRYDQQFLDALGRAMESAESSVESRTTWQNVLTNYSRMSERQTDPPLPPLLIDAPSLAEAGVTATTTVMHATGETAVERASALLEASNLAVVDQGDVLLLTSNTSLHLPPDALWQDSNQPGQDSNQSEVVVDTGRTIDGWSSAARSSLRLLTIEAWMAESQLPQLPWSTPTQVAYDSLTAAGWTGYRTSVVDKPVELLVYEPRALATFAMAVLLITVGSVWWFAARRPIWLVPLGGLAGAVALLMPEPFVPLATSFFLGVLAAGVLILAGRRKVASVTLLDASSSKVSSSAAIASPVVLCLGALLLVLAATAAAQTPPPQPPAEPVKPADNIYEVVVPIDDQKQPIGDYVFLPRPFYDALYQRIAIAKSIPRGWLLTSAEYRCVLDWESAGSRFDVAELAVTYEVDVLQPKTRVLIPLARAGLSLLQDRCQLDGKAVQADWQPDDKSLGLTVETPGKHQLELVLIPAIHNDGQTARLDVSIPPLASSRLKIQPPSGAFDLEVPTARGGTYSDADSGQQITELGPTDRLEVRWPVTSGTRSASSKLDVEELFWLKVRAASVVVDARFKFSAFEGSIRQLQLLAEPRLRLLSLDASRPVARQYVREGDSQTIVVEFQEPFGNEVTLSASFLLTGTSGIGNLRLPWLEAHADRTLQHWLAVSVSPSLEFKVVDEPQWQPLAAADFAAAWNDVPDSQPAPQLVYRLSPGATRWSLATKPRETHTVASQQLDFSVAGGEGQVRFDARLSTLSGYHFQHRLSVPPKLQIHNISVLEKRVERVLRWSRDDSGSLTVFLNGPVTAEHRLSLNGTVPLTQRGQCELPQIAITSAEIKNSEFRIYRRSAVQVSVLNTSNLIEAGNVETGRFHESLGRLVAALQWDGSHDSPTAATLSVQPNQPQIQCRLITALRRSAGTWTAEIDCGLQVRNGVADVIRVEIPAELSKPFQIDPVLPFEVERVPAQQRRWLLVRPANAISGDFHFRLSAALSAAPGERVAAPDVALLDADKMERFLIVPTQVEAQQIAWETSGLQATTVPEVDAALVGDLSSYATFEVVGSRYEAMIKHVERVSGVPQVWLADIHLAWQRDGSCLGVATFDLEPAGLTHCTLTLPATYQLIQATVAGLPAMLEATGPQRWRLNLGPDQLPQRVSVVYQGHLPPADSSGRQHFAAPLLHDMAVERTLWSIQGPPATGTGQPQPADSQIDALRQELFRLDATATLIDLASDVVSENAPKEIARWYLPWAQQLIATQAKIDYRRLQHGPSTSVDLSRVQSTEREQESVAKRLGTTLIRNQAAAERVRTAGAAELLYPESRKNEPILRCSFLGVKGTIDVRYPPVQTSTLSQRGLAALMFACLAALTFLLLRRRVVADWLVPRLYAVGVLIGLAWWLWLTPSLIGWVIVIASIVSAIRFPWVASPLPVRTAAVPSSVTIRSLR
jgi:hypothetical protein